MFYKAHSHNVFHVAHSQYITKTQRYKLMLKQLKKYFNNTQLMNLHQGHSMLNLPPCSTILSTLIQLKSFERAMKIIKNKKMSILPY